ncbi:MAG TPA: GspH/FimT family pseudopilin [Planctomycetota bacterium]|jgi:prepilin-type N-terminal cleavage/methylation domain-containing protein
MSWRKQTRQHMRATGFTLLELVLVMLIVTVLAGIAAPSLRGFLAGRKSSDAAAQVIALAQYGRVQAVSSGNVYRLNLDADGLGYWLTVQRGADFGELGTEFGRRFTLPEGMTGAWNSQASSEGHMDFFPNGRTTATTLLLVDGQGKVFEIGCRSETERVALIQRE